MLLLDYWPLGRMRKAEGRRHKAATPGTLDAPRSTLLRLVNEKIPFFVLSGISCFLTYSTERDAQGTAGFDASPAPLRLENALAAYARYLGKTFWPAKLAVPYVNPGHWSWLEVGGSVLVLAGVGLVVLWLRRRRPYLLVGWCWFLGTMIPVIGLTRGWGSFMSDRFTYVPSIGVLMLTVWGAGELTRRWRYHVLALSVAGGAAIMCCLALTRQQLGHWKNSETLFRHVLEVTKGNVVAHNDLGNALLKDGKIEEAIRHYQEALHLKANYAEAHYNLGVALDQKGQMDEAIRHYQEAIRVEPAYADAHNNLGIDFYQQGRTGEAIRQFQEALRLRPDHAQIRNNLAHAQSINAQIEGVTGQLQESLRLNPDHVSTNR
jgi:tetratricopeptide (TPR) repeat protein